MGGNIVVCYGLQHIYFNLKFYKNLIFITLNKINDDMKIFT